MAALPKRKTSKARRNDRRSHDKLTKMRLVVSPVTGKRVPRGVVCVDNPVHKGIEVIKS